LEEIMIIAMSSESAESRKLQVFFGHEHHRADVTRRIGSLVDAWLMQQYRPGPDAGAVRRAERRLHEAIKASPLHGKILSFAGLNLWVDDQTPEGVVRAQECINL
jgi:hypothetical protein